MTSSGNPVASKGLSQLRGRSRRGPCSKPQSTRTERSCFRTKNLDPVTVDATQHLDHKGQVSNIRKAAAIAAMISTQRIQPAPLLMAKLDAIQAPVMLPIPKTRPTPRST